MSRIQKLTISNMSESMNETIKSIIASLWLPSSGGRPVERIDAILSIVREAWVQNPDLRLWQLLINAWMNYNTEDLSDLVALLNKSYNTTPLLWWTRWKSWKAKLKYLQLWEITDEHLENIIKTQREFLKTSTMEILEKEYVKRLQKIWKQ